MSSRRTRVEIITAIALLLVLGLSLSQARQGMRASYVLTFPPPSGPEVVCAVHLVLEGASRDSLELVGVADRTAFDLHDLTVTDDHGKPIPFHSADRTLTLPSDKQFLQHRYALRAPLPARLHVRYRARIGVRQGDEHVGFNGKCFGLVSPEAVVFSGRSIFLIPDVGDSPCKVAVSFNVPSGWEVLAPWKGKGSVRYPGVLRGDELEHLAASTVGVGKFRVTRKTERGTEWAFAVPASVPARDADPVLSKVGAATSYITSIFRRGLGARYLTFVLPKSMRKDEVPGEGWATGQGETLIPLTSNRLREFAAQLVDAYVLHAPFRSTLADQRDYWLPTGLRRYYGTKALVAAGIMGRDELAPALAVRVATAPGSESGPLRLELAFDVPGRDLPGGEPIAAALLYDMDRTIRNATSERRSLDDVTAETFRSARARSPWSVLSSLAPKVDWRTYRQYFLAEGHFAPLETFPGLTVLPKTPTPSPGLATHRIRLICTGATGSFLEICGCKTNQSGGAARRGTMLRRLRSEGIPSLYVDAGNALPPPGPFRPDDPFSVAEVELALSILRDQGVSAIGVSTFELTWGADFYKRLAAATSAPFVTFLRDSASQPLAPEVRMANVDGLKIAFLSAFEPPLYLDGQGSYENHAAEFAVPDPLQGLPRALDAIRPRADLVCVVGRLTPSFVRRLLSTCSDIDIVVSNEPFALVTGAQKDGRPRFYESDQPGFIGRSVVIYTDHLQYGMTVADLDVTSDRRIAGATFSTRELTAEVPDDPGVRARLSEFYRSVGRALGGNAAVQSPFAADSVRWHGAYLGAEGCRSCHSEEYAQWLRTPHAKAYKTLLDAHRNYQPRCVTCHVVAYGAPHGYRFGDPSPRLVNVQCEVCHGPGAEHSRDPENAHALPGASRQVCVSCHTSDHSNAFVFEERLPHVLHTSAQTLAGNQAGPMEGAAGH